LIGIFATWAVTIFQAAPQPLDEDVVQKSPFAVHADPHASVRKLVQERGAGELHALIGVEYFWPAMPVHRLAQCIDAKVRLHGDRKPPRQHPPAEPVHHRHQINKPFGHWDIRDVRAPHLVRPVNDQTS
jgi:hypothetical protein